MYQRELEKILKETVPGEKKLLLHSCCAPCSSYCMEYLRQYFKITVFYYNPNITDEEEYKKRVKEQKRLIEAYNAQAKNVNSIDFIEGEYEPDMFRNMSKGLEDVPEGGERCFACYALRLKRTAELAEKEGFDYFTTTLTISPLKSAAKLNEIGKRLEKESALWLPSDFKKKNGYKRSIELSKEFGLYRQNFCGCDFSKKDRL